MKATSVCVPAAAAAGCCCCVACVRLSLSLFSACVGWWVWGCVREGEGVSTGLGAVVFGLWVRVGRAVRSPLVGLGLGFDLGWACLTPNNQIVHETAWLYYVW